VNVDIPPVLLVNGYRVDLGIRAALLHRLSDQERGAALVHLCLP